MNLSGEPNTNSLYATTLGNKTGAGTPTKGRQIKGHEATQIPTKLDILTNAGRQMKGDTKAHQHQEHLGCIEKNSEQQTVGGNTRISSCFASKRHDWLRKVSARKNRIRPSSSGLQLRISRCSSKLPQVQQNELELNGYQIGTHALQVCTLGQPII